MCRTTKKVHVGSLQVCVCVATMVHPTARFFFFFSPCRAFIGSKRSTACPVVPRCHCDDDDLDLVCQYF